jgi:hypothetical protein
MDKSKALQNKIQVALNDQKTWLPEIDSYIDFLKGKQYPEKPKKDQVTFNILHTTIQAILRSILTGKSYIYVDPASGEAINFYEIVEKVINDWWVRLDIQTQIEFSVLDYAALGMGVTYTDWDFRLDVKGEIISDTPFALNIPYKDFLIDPETQAQEINEAKYMIRKYVKLTKELKADPRYKKTKNIKGDVKLKSNISGQASGEQIDRTTLFQIWIPEDQCSYVMRQDSDDILREVPNKLGREYPFELLQNYKMPDELRPFGEIKILYEPQKILNRLYSLVITHAKRVSNRQFTANEQVKDSELRKLKDAEDGEIIKVEGTARASDVITPIMDLQLSADVYRAFELINNAIVQLSAVSEYRRNIMPKSERKATEAAFVEQASEMSSNAKSEDVGKHCEAVARKLFKHEANVVTREITYKDEKTGDWIAKPYNGSSFPGVYDFKWESGVAAPINAQNRQGKSIQLINGLALLVRGAPQLAQTINWTELLRSTLTDFDTKNKEKILTPDPNMQMQQMQPQGVQGGQGNIVSQMMGQ